MVELFGWARRAVGLSLLFVFFSLLIPGHLRAGEGEKKTDANLGSKADYILNIEKGLISLFAKDASLKQIVEEMGRELNIEVEALIAEDDRITVEFQALSLEDALKRLSSNYYLHYSKAENDKDKISKIVLLPEGEGKGQSAMPHTGGADVRVVGTQKAPGKTTREQVTEASQEKASKKPKEKETTPKPFKFEFNP